jgi:hypothetical protein
MFLALFLQHGYATDESSPTRLHRVGQLLANREYLRMGIVRVQNNNLLGFLSLPGQGYHHHQYEANNSNHNY